MRRAIPWILCVVIGGVGDLSGAQAQDPHLPRVSPEYVGMCSQRLVRFDTLAAEYVDSGHVAGGEGPVRLDQPWANHIPEYAAAVRQTTGAVLWAMEQEFSHTADDDTVVATGRAATDLRDGLLVTVDGAAGTVTITTGEPS